MATPPARSTPLPTIPGFHFRTLAHDGREYPYAVYVPRDLAAPGPGLVFLHGRGECGTDGSRMLGVGLPAALIWDSARWPFAVVIPQKPDQDSQWEDHAGAVLAMLDAAIADGLIDARRVAITGLSQGGHGTLAIASMHPLRFRAAVPVCGYINPRKTPKGYGPTDAADPHLAAMTRGLGTMPVWAFHGKLDDIVPPNESQLIADALNAAGGSATITLFPDANHNAWDPAYRSMGVELSAWLLDRTR